MSGPLPNPKHERLAQEKANGAGLADGLKAAGYSPTAGGSRKLWSHPLIEARVAELRAKAVIARNALVTTAAKVSEEGAVITLANLIEEADEIKREAMAAENPNYGAAVSALTLKARLAGFLHDKPPAAGDTFNIAFIKAPPQETFEQFNERRSRQLRLVGTSARSTNGSGRSDMVS